MRVLRTIVLCVAAPLLALGLSGCIIAPARPVHGGPAYGGGSYGHGGGAPVVGTVWIDGFWDFRLGRRVWVDGHWGQPRRGR